MRVRPNPPFEGISPVAHGALDPGELERLGVDPAEVVDFSASINPYGPAPIVLEAARRADVSGYPDRGCLGLRRALSEHLGVGLSWIAPGNGSAELIDLLARVYLSPGDAALVVGPTFGEYERACRLCGARVLRWDREVRGAGVSLDLDGLLEAVLRERPRVMWLCNPNNPTGDLLSGREVRRLLAAVEEVGGLLVVDEAYRELVLRGEPDDLTGLLLEERGLILLRSMTKAHALAGLRLGYALAPPEVVRALAVARPPWSVSAPAQAAGIAALSPGARRHLSRCRRLLARDAELLAAGLARLGLATVPGVANFLLVEVGDGGRVREALLRRNLQVRDCASFGLPAHIRVAVRLPEENARLLAALEEVVPL
ncbi:Histidinol-phosphate aminotransferase [Rubrobacter xylanophilus DSM 9941]|nr:Histidinol-phosphate aminotransferase [Rubrobacter xylanophilus DSM 9941]